MDQGEPPGPAVGVRRPHLEGTKFGHGPGEAAECKCDRQDRILIPPTLRQYAELEKEIVLVGVLKHFEIWSRDHWAAEKEELGSDMQKEELGLEIAKLGL